MSNDVLFKVRLSWTWTIFRVGQRRLNSAPSRWWPAKQTCPWSPSSSRRESRAGGLLLPETRRTSLSSRYLEIQGYLSESAHYVSAHCCRPLRGKWRQNCTSWLERKPRETQRVWGVTNLSRWRNPSTVDVLLSPHFSHSPMSWSLYLGIMKMWSAQQLQIQQRQRLSSQKESTNCSVQR